MKTVLHLKEHFVFLPCTRICVPSRRISEIYQCKEACLARQLSVPLGVQGYSPAGFQRAEPLEGGSGGSPALKR